VSARRAKPRQKMKHQSLGTLIDVEMDLRARGYRYVIGVDDTGGAGCIAGPIVVASCCILKPLPWFLPIETHIVSHAAMETLCKVNDCKVLTSEQRQEIYDTVQLYPDIFAFSIVQRSPQQVDEMSLPRATQGAFAESIETLVEKYTLPVAEIYAIVDGNVSPKLYSSQRQEYHLLKECDETDLPHNMSELFPVRPYVNGDAHVYTVALASIIARVFRDAIMNRLHHQHPLYGFAEHAGFGRRDHIEAIHRLGAIEGVHRMSFKQVKGR
jgi:ribonuclease HII